MGARIALAGLASVGLAALTLNLAPMLLPAWGRVLGMLAPELAAPTLGLLDGRVSLSAGLGQGLLVGTHWLAFDARHRVAAAVPLGPALLAPALWLALATGLWMLRAPRASAAPVAPAARVAAALVAAAMLLLLETPLLLTAAVHDELLRQLSPGHGHPLVTLAQWWNHGGRWLMAAAVAAALLWPWLPGAGRADQRADQRTDRRTASAAGIAERRSTHARSSRSS